MRVLGFLLFVLLINNGAFAQGGLGWLGADVQDVTKAEADKLKWDSPRGAKVGVVASGSPAEKAGLKSGDIILSIDRMLLETSSDAEAAFAAKRPGDELRLLILSQGSERRITVTLAERPKAEVGQDQAEPLLMLDTGGHMALIASLAFTPDGKQLLSAGDDKVVRVWDWQAKTTVRTIRWQVGPADEGKIYAMALSPDGRLVAIGGWMAGRGTGDIGLYRFDTGMPVALLRGHTQTVTGLAFSPDGKRLLSSSFEPTAIIWDVTTHKLLFRLQGHKSGIMAVAFTPDGSRAITGSDDTTLRLWRVTNGSLIAEMRGHAKAITRALAVRSQDSLIASGDDSGEIRLWEGKTGRPLRILGSQGDHVGSLRFSLDGNRLLSTCGYKSCGLSQRVWNVASGENALVYTRHTSSVLANALSPDGNLVATAGGDYRIHIWDLATGETKSILTGTGRPTIAVGFSRDGQSIAWGNTSHYADYNNRGSLDMTLQLPRSGSALGHPEKIDGTAEKRFLRARATFGAYSLAAREGGSYGYDANLDIKMNGEVQRSIERQPKDGYAHLSYSFTPDGQSIVSGGGVGVLSAYDLTGRSLGEFIGHEGDVWAVAPSPDGRLLVSGSQDQTIRLWNLKTRELIVTLFDGSDGEWVMWTPQGYYAGSPGADKIVGWQINKGPERAPDYVGAEQLRRHLNRPDIVEKAIVLASADAAVRSSPGTSFKLADLLARPVPRFSIVAPIADAPQHGGRAAVKIVIQATPDPIKAIRVQVNGRQVEEETPDIGSGGFGAGERILDVPLAKGRNDVRVTLTNAIGEKAETVTLNHEGDGALDKRGTLYLLAIGVDKYPGLGNSCGDDGKSTCDLDVSGADARALVAAVEKRLGPAHDKIVKRLLVNGAGANNEPTAANILDAIDVLKQAKETDTVLLFIAGHGFNDGPNYRFLATNAVWDGSVLRGSTIVPWYALQEAVETAKGRRILFIDTCHSGNAYNQQLGNAAYHANIIAYTAARFDQEAIEDAKLGHGLFTYAVVEGLEGKGGLAARRQISTKDLADYVIKRVEELAKAQKQDQEPQYFKGRDAEDYVLARW
jgi:WD40 repeat protein